MTGELAKILAHIDKIGELDIADVPPTAHVLDVVNVGRADKARPSWPRERGAQERAGRERRLVPRAEDELGVGTLDPLRLTAREAKRLLVDGEVSAAELAKVYLDQIARRRGPGARLHPGDGRERRQLLDQGGPRDAGDARRRSPACRIAVKDNMVTEGVVTTCASRILHNYQPIYTATAVRKLWDDHVVMLGKTNMDEFAMGSSTENSCVRHHAQPVGPEPPCRAAPAAAPPPPWPPARRCGPWAPTPAAPSASRPPSAASSA